MWHLKSAVDTAKAVKRGEVSSAALVEHYIERIERLDDKINAVVVRMFDEARARAKEADAALARGQSWGELHGVPITIKEAFWIDGTLSTCAVAETIDFVATSNAPAVQSYLDAGAVILGKTNLPVAAADFQSFNDKYGTTNNPHDLSRIPGGSSGGSAAAIAAGLSALELGSDIGGSIRNPAHFCGVCGHKPSQGIVPLHGHSPGGNEPSVEKDPKPNRGRMDPSFGHNLAVAGPIARTCADLELAMRLLAKPEPTRAMNGWSFTLPPATLTDVSSLRVACWLDDEFCRVDGESVELLTAAAERLAAAGATVDYTARPYAPPFIPSCPSAKGVRLCLTELASDGAAASAQGLGVRGARQGVPVSAHGQHEPGRPASHLHPVPGPGGQAPDVQGEVGRVLRGLGRPALPGHAYVRLPARSRHVA